MSSTGCEHTHNGTKCKKCRTAYYNAIVVKKKAASVEKLVIGKQNLSEKKLLIWICNFLQTLKKKLRSGTLKRDIAWKAFEKVFPKDQEIIKEFYECVKKIRDNMNPSYDDRCYYIYSLGMFYGVEIPKFPSDPVAPVTPVNPVAPAYHLCTNCEKNCGAGVNFYEKKAYCNAHFCKKCAIPKPEISCGKCRRC
jgi:hypothetical protein